MGSVERVDFFQAKERLSVKRSPLYQKALKIEDPDESLLAFTQAVIQEPHIVTLEELTARAKKRMKENPDSPIGWYARAISHYLHEENQKGYEAMLEVYNRRDKVRYISAVCLSVLNTIHLTEAVRELTEMFATASIKESPYDPEIRMHAEYGAQRIGMEGLENIIETSRQRARFGQD